MTGLSSFQPSVSGMSGQSRAMEAIGDNIANATTDGYKRAEVSFRTLLSRTFASAPAISGAAAPQNVQSDIGGTEAVLRNHIIEAGQIKPTGAALDLAIDGRGFFVLGSDVDGSGATLYGRAGHFGLTPAADGSGGYLVDSNNHYLQGWPAGADPTVVPGGAPQAMRIDFGATLSAARQTSVATATLQVPAGAAIDARETFGTEVFDPAGRALPLTMTLTKTATNVWQPAIEGGAGRVVDVAAAGGGPATLGFDPLGQPLSPATFTATVTEAGGTPWSFEIDLSGAVQWGGPFGLSDYVQDGYPQGKLLAIDFDTVGRVVGQFDNGRAQPLFQLAIANFANADGLAPLAGTVYAQTELSGAATLGVAGNNGVGRIVPGAIEQSNVDIAAEFSRMILTQTAYNSSATAFRTLDEMTELARDLKRA